MDPEDGLPSEVAAAMERLDHAVKRFEEYPEPAVKDLVVDLLRCVDIIHRAGLRRLDDLLKVAGLQQRAVEDPEVRLLFDLYDLGEGGDRQRADAVLAEARPYIESHGGQLELVDAEAGVVTVRLHGACQDCRGSSATVHHLVEQTLRDGMPGFVRLDVVEPEPGPVQSSSFVPLAQLVAPPSPRLAWHAVLRTDELPSGTVCGVTVTSEPVLVANVDGEFYAYRNACPGTPFPLDQGYVEAGTLRCPWHGCRFNLRGGRRVEVDGAGLGVVPVAVQDGDVRIGFFETVPA